MKKNNKKPDWELIFYVAFIVLMALVIILCFVIRVWVVIEYGDAPIVDVPTWAIPWIINFSGVLL